MLIIQAWSYSLLSLFLLFFVKIGLWSLLLSTLISTFLSLLFGFFCLKRRFWISGNIRKRVSFSLLRYGLHFYIGGVLGQLQQYGTQLLSVTYLVPSQMAFLNQGQSVGKLLNKLVDPLNTLLYPRICKSDDIQAINISTLTFRISVIILSSFAILFAIIAKPLVLTLYGISFSQTVTIIYYLLPGVVTAGISSTLINYFLGTGRAKLIPRIQIIPVFIQLFLAWEFTKKWGLQGASISISITSIIYSGIIIVLFIKVTKISIVQLFPLKKDFILIFSNVILLIRNRNK
jgi:O-antigen/teichoic acid export membrane protein